jgi:hypothetical protein
MPHQVAKRESRVVQRCEKMKQTVCWEKIGRVVKIIEAGGAFLAS